MWVVNEHGNLEGLDYKKYQAMTEQEKAELKENFIYQGEGKWTVKPASVGKCTVELSDYTKKRIARFFGKETEEFIINRVVESANHHLKELVREKVVEFLRSPEVEKYSKRRVL